MSETVRASVDITSFTPRSNRQPFGTVDTPGEAPHHAVRYFRR